MAMSRCEGQFTEAGRSSPANFLGYFNLTLWGDFAGEVQLERSFDAGETWHALRGDRVGRAARFSAPTSTMCEEWERGVLYRLHCTALRSGVLRYRLSQ